MSTRLSRIAGWAACVVLVGFIVFCGIWRAEGGRWERVETPSMGTVAPVGTLLWVRPVRYDALRPGDFISFHPPGQPGVTYSHLVHARHADGSLTTKGVIPAPDPWRLHEGDVVGEVAMRWWGVGWLVSAAPVLVVGLLVIGGVRSMLRPSVRLPAAVVLVALLVSLALAIYRPLDSAASLGFRTVAAGGAEATYVGTGLLPVRVEAESGGQVVLAAGEVGRVHLPVADATGHFRVRVVPAIPWWFWVGLVGACFVPALCVTTRRTNYLHVTRCHANL